MSKLSAWWRKLLHKYPQPYRSPLASPALSKAMDDAREELSEPGPCKHGSCDSLLADPDLRLAMRAVEIAMEENLSLGEAKRRARKELRKAHE